MSNVPMMQRAPVFRFSEYRDARGEWRWRLVARNGKIVADSGEGYKTRAGMHAATIRLYRAILVTES